MFNFKVTQSIQNFVLAKRKHIKISFVAVGLKLKS